MLEGLKHQSIKDDSKVCNIHRINFKELISRVPLHQATTDESEIIPVPQLKEKFSSTNLRSKKLTILTVLSQSWTLPKIQEQFGVTRCLHYSPSSEELGMRKGMLSTPKCCAGKNLPIGVKNLPIGVREKRLFLTFFLCIMNGSQQHFLIFTPVTLHGAYSN